MPATPFSTVPNLLLSRLPAAERSRFINACEIEQLTFSQVIAQPGDGVDAAYFPTGGFISLLVPMGEHDALEVSLAGNEGFYGMPLVLGIAMSPVQALVQGSGTALKMGAARFQRELMRLPALRSIVDRYIHVAMSQMSQTAACNRYHVVEQRVARWLLMTADRAHIDTVPITHEFLAYMLGVRRVGITEAALSLQARGLITYKRGVVTIVNRHGLERAACPCYWQDLATYKEAFA